MIDTVTINIIFISGTLGFIGCIIYNTLKFKKEMKEQQEINKGLDDVLEKRMKAIVDQNILLKEQLDESEKLLDEAEFALQSYKESSPNEQG
jgi:hypothetical protein